MRAAAHRRLPIPHILSISEWPLLVWASSTSTTLPAHSIFFSEHYTVKAGVHGANDNIRHLHALFNRRSTEKA